jgi:hypothetical protein
LSAPSQVSFEWKGLSGLMAADWQFTSGETMEMPWARWASPHYGPEEAWTTSFILHCMLLPNTERLDFDAWLKGALVDSEKAFRTSVREQFAGFAAMRSAPVPGFDHLDTLLYVYADRRIYQFRISGLAAEQRWGESQPLSDLLAALRIDHPEAP